MTSNKVGKPKSDDRKTLTLKLSASTYERIKLKSQVKYTSMHSYVLDILNDDAFNDNVLTPEQHEEIENKEKLKIYKKQMDEVNKIRSSELKLITGPLNDIKRIINLVQDALFTLESRNDPNYTEKIWPELMEAVRSQIKISLAKYHPECIEKHPFMKYSITQLKSLNSSETLMHYAKKQFMRQVYDMNRDKHHIMLKDDTDKIEEINYTDEPKIIEEVAEMVEEKINQETVPIKEMNEPTTEIAETSVLSEDQGTKLLNQRPYHKDFWDIVRYYINPDQDDTDESIKLIPHPYFLEKLLPFARNREFSVLVPKFCFFLNKDLMKGNRRYQKLHSVEKFHQFIRFGGYFRHYIPLFNMYYSLASYKGGVDVNMIKYDLRIQEIEAWKLVEEQRIESYDMLIDVDVDGHHEFEVAKQGALILMRVLDDFNVPYEVRFSGSGFHIVIPYYAFKDIEAIAPDGKFAGNNAISYFFLIACFLKREKVNIIDDSIYDLKRICKLPYSVAIYGDNCYVALPFDTFEAVENCELDDFLLKNVIKRYKDKTLIVPMSSGSYYFNRFGDAKKLFDATLKYFENKSRPVQKVEEYND